MQYDPDKAMENDLDEIQEGQPDYPNPYEEAEQGIDEEVEDAPEFQAQPLPAAIPQSYDGTPNLPSSSDLETVGGIVACIETAIKEFIASESYQSPERGRWVEFCLRCMPSLNMRSHDPSRVRGGSVANLKKFDVATWTLFYLRYPFMALLQDQDRFMSTRNAPEGRQVIKEFKAQVRNRFKYVSNQPNLQTQLEVIKFNDRRVFQGTILLPILDPRQSDPMNWEQLHSMKKYSDYVSPEAGITSYRSLCAAIHRCVINFSTYAAPPALRTESEQVKEWYRISALDLPSIHADDFYPFNAAKTETISFTNQTKNEVAIWARFFLNGPPELYQLAKKQAIFNRTKLSRNFRERILRIVETARNRFGKNIPDMIPMPGHLLSEPVIHMMDDPSEDIREDFQTWKREFQRKTGKQFYFEIMLEIDVLSDKWGPQRQITFADAPINLRIEPLPKPIESRLSKLTMRDGCLAEIQDHLEQLLDHATEGLDIQLNGQGYYDFFIYTAPHLNLKEPISPKESREGELIKNYAINLWARIMQDKPAIAQLIWFGHLFPYNQVFVSQVLKKFDKNTRGGKATRPVDLGLLPPDIFSLHYTAKFKHAIIERSGHGQRITREEMKAAKYWSNYLQWKNTDTIRGEMLETMDMFVKEFPQHRASAVYIPSLHPEPFDIPVFGDEGETKIISSEYLQRLHRQEENDVTAWALLCTFYGFKWYVQKMILFAQQPHFRKRIILRTNYFEENFDALRQAVAAPPFSSNLFIDYSTRPLKEILHTARIAWMLETSFTIYPSLDPELANRNVIRQQEDFVIPHTVHEYQRLFRVPPEAGESSSDLPSPISKGAGRALNPNLTTDSDRAEHNLELIMDNLSFEEEVPVLGMNETRKGNLARVTSNGPLMTSSPIKSSIASTKTPSIPNATEIQLSTPPDVNRGTIVKIIEHEIQDYLRKLSPELQQRAEILLRLMPSLHIRLDYPLDVAKAQSMQLKVRDLELEEIKIWGSFLLFRKEILRLVLEENFLVTPENSNNKDRIEMFRAKVLEQCERFRNHPDELKEITAKEMELIFRIGILRKGGLLEEILDENKQIQADKLKHANNWEPYVAEVIQSNKALIEELDGQLKTFGSNNPQLENEIFNIPSLHSDDYNLPKDKKSELVQNQRENDIIAWAHFLAEFPYPLEHLATRGHIFNSNSVARNFYLECQIRKEKNQKSGKLHSVPDRLPYTGASCITAYDQGVPQGIRRNPIYRRLPYWRYLILHKVPLQTLPKAAILLMNEMQSRAMLQDPEKMACARRQDSPPRKRSKREFEP